MMITFPGHSPATYMDNCTPCYISPSWLDLCPFSATPCYISPSCLNLCPFSAIPCYISPSWLDLCPFSAKPHTGAVWTGRSGSTRGCRTQTSSGCTPGLRTSAAYTSSSSSCLGTCSGVRVGRGNKRVSRLLFELELSLRLLDFHASVRVYSLRLWDFRRTLSERKVLDEEGVALDVILPLLGALDYLHSEVSEILWYFSSRVLFFSSYSHDSLLKPTPMTQSRASSTETSSRRTSWCLPRD